jgi:hypothetical protein
MEAFGRYVRSLAPEARASFARAVSFSNPACRNLILTFPTFYILGQCTARLVFQWLYRMFCPAADLNAAGGGYYVVENSSGASVAVDDFFTSRTPQLKRMAQ